MSKANRFAQTMDLADAITAIRHGASVKSRLHMLMLASIPKAHKEVYDWFERTIVLDDGENPYTTAREVSERFGISMPYASSLLKELVDFCLLEREYITDESGRFFVYKYASWERETWITE